MHADHAHARVGQERVHQAFHAAAGLVAHGNQVGQGQRAPLHGQVQADVAALRNQRHAALYALATVLVWPQGHAVQIVQHAVAVGAQQGHITRVVHELLLQSDAFAAHLGKARGVANHAACTARGQLAHDVHRGVAWHRHKAGVGRMRQRGHVGVAGQAFDFAAGRMNRPNLPGKPEFSALANGLGRRSATEHRNMAWRKQALQLRATSAVCHGWGRRRAHAPCTRSMAREMMWRWISLVPSQMRSTRASRQ